MKKILFFLMILCGVSTAQYVTTVGDTTDLKLTKGSGIVLLEQFGKGNLTGGGLFHRIDSTYAEGRDAFDYPTDGLQWARIGYVEYGEMFISSVDTTALTTDSTYYLINGFTAGNSDGVTLTDSSVTLISDAYYSFQASFTFTASDSITGNTGLYKNDVQDTTIQADFQVPDTLAKIQNITLSGVVYSDGNDVFKLKVATMSNYSSKEFIIRKSNVKFVKLN